MASRAERLRRIATVLERRANTAYSAAVVGMACGLGCVAAERPGLAGLSAAAILGCYAAAQRFEMRRYDAEIALHLHEAARAVTRSRSVLAAVESNLRANPFYRSP